MNVKVLFGSSSVFFSSITDKVKICEPLASKKSKCKVNIIGSNPEIKAYKHGPTLRYRKCASDSSPWSSS